MNGAQEWHTPFGAEKHIFSASALGNDGFGGGLGGGFQRPLERKPFNQEVLSVRSGASSVGGHHRDMQRGPFARGGVVQLQTGTSDGGDRKIANILCSPRFRYPDEAERSNFGKVCTRMSRGSRQSALCQMHSSQLCMLVFITLCSFACLCLDTPSDKQAGRLTHIHCKYTQAGTHKYVNSFNIRTDKQVGRRVRIHVKYTQADTHNSKCLHYIHISASRGTWVA